MPRNLSPLPPWAGQQGAQQTAPSKAAAAGIAGWALS